MVKKTKPTRKKKPAAPRPIVRPAVTDTPTPPPRLTSPASVTASTHNDNYWAGYAAASHGGERDQCTYVFPSKDFDDWQNGFQDGRRTDDPRRDRDRDDCRRKPFWQSKELWAGFCLFGLGLVSVFQGSQTMQEHPEATGLVASLFGALWMVLRCLTSQGISPTVILRQPAPPKRET